jgi:hypothetical protein
MPKNIIKNVFLFALVFFIILLFVKPPLPNISDINNSVINVDPIQKEISIPPIRTKFGDYTYEITPLYSYEIYGLAISDYSSNNWLDITHKKDPANTKDICVTWGDNIGSGAYKKVKYKHGEFTCYYYYNEKIDPSFNGRFLSNNHLIPKDKNVKNQIGRVNIGDQIHIKGYLANYIIFDKNGKQISSRNTSTTREDSGNGACEIIYVDKIEVIKKASVIYYSLKAVLPYLLFFSLGFLFIKLLI